MSKEKIKYLLDQIKDEADIYIAALVDEIGVLVDGLENKMTPQAVGELLDNTQPLQFEAVLSACLKSVLATNNIECTVIDKRCVVAVDDIDLAAIACDFVMKITTLDDDGNYGSHYMFAECDVLAPVKHASRTTTSE